MRSLSLYRNFARTAFAKIRPQESQEPLDIEVAIEGGLHAGSLIPLKRQRLEIGASETGDVMLLDPAVAGEPVFVTPERSLLGPMISVASQRADIRLNGRPVETAREAQTFRLPCALTIGDVPMRVSVDEKTQMAQRSFADMAMIAGLACLCVLAFGFATSWGQRQQSSFNLMTQAQSAPLPSASNPVQGALMTKVTASLVSQTLADYDLSDYLAAVPKSGQSIAITGNLPDDMRDSWYAARDHLHIMNSEMQIITDFEVTPAHPQLPAIASIRFGDNPGLIFADNSTATIGDILVDDWQLAAIDETGFRLTRFGVTITIDY